MQRAKQEQATLTIRRARHAPRAAPQAPPVVVSGGMAPSAPAAGALLWGAAGAAQALLVATLALLLAGLAVAACAWALRARRREAAAAAAAAAARAAEEAARGHAQLSAEALPLAWLSVVLSAAWPAHLESWAAALTRRALQVRCGARGVPGRLQAAGWGATFASSRAALARRIHPTAPKKQASAAGCPRPHPHGARPPEATQTRLPRVDSTNGPCVAQARTCVTQGAGQRERSAACPFQ